MKMLPILLCFLPVAALGQVAVIDGANLATARSAQTQNIAKWVESIGKLKTQIDQLKQQIAIQDDIRAWAGNPAEATAKMVLGGLGQDDLLRQYGESKDVVLGLVNSLGSLADTAQGSYRAIASVDINGDEFQRDPLTFRRYSVLDAKKDNSDTVADETKAREEVLQSDVAATLTQLKTATTDAEVQKLTAKLTALNGQLAQVDATRRREVDEVTLQKIANDSRKEEEMQAAAEQEARDDFVANQRVSAYMRTLKLRTKPPGN